MWSFPIKGSCLVMTGQARAIDPIFTSYGIFVVCALTIIMVSGDEGPRTVQSEKVSETVWPVGDPNRCLELFQNTEQDIQRFGVFPGLGWDNLRNVEASQVVHYTFDHCKLTNDGRYLIPDNVFTVPLKTSRVVKFAEVIDQWKNTSSLTARTINSEAGLTFKLVGISGKFSQENTIIKKKQIEDKAVTTRVKLQYNRYEVKLQPDSRLSSQFKSRLMEIAARIELDHIDMATFHSQMVVRDFGTHYLTSVTAGAALVKDDFIKRDFVATHTSDKPKILAFASSSFYKLFNLGFSYQRITDSGVDASYASSLTYSYVRALGGPKVFTDDFSADDWAAEVNTNLVPMDRAGDPLYFLINSKTLPELPENLVVEVAEFVRLAIETYYETNVIRGCTRQDSPQFSPFANFDDGSCTAPPTTTSFGGVYQTCSVSGRYLHRNPCSGLSEVNPKTGRHSCPATYTAVKLYQGSKLGVVETSRHCRRCGFLYQSLLFPDVASFTNLFSFQMWLPLPISSLSRCGFLYLERCCGNTNYQARANYITYWCAAFKATRPETGYLFGGLYTSTGVNLVTGVKGCPRRFSGIQVLVDLVVCMSDDYELSKRYAVPFGGFFSCSEGNPLAISSTTTNPWPAMCPEGYSQHLATVVTGCAFHYCLESGALTGPSLPAISRPPFMMKPVVPMEDDPNVKDDVVVFNMDTQTWMKDLDAFIFVNMTDEQQPCDGVSGECVTSPTSVP
ncbi:hypothetical protein RRG08_047682 [Elysia crispata]|uniref:MACPF domain-containing protein n=1 Tax=Elysia crispata TaxID=231223 RepID=A0AAE1BCR1_9GAST|nr:hypothetical protein RRG08_047682 [Elysia crispata]